MIIAYDPVNELKYAARNLGMKISSNSWGYDADTDIFPPHRLQSVGAQTAEALKSQFGYYPNFNFATDHMINKTDVLVFYAAGNEAYSIVLLPLPDEMNNIRVPDEWHRTYPRFDTMLVNASAELIKAILINSARDLGLAGPDYTYGYGMVDAQLGARTISGQEDVKETEKVKSRFIEDRIKHKQEPYFFIFSMVAMIFFT